MTEEKFASVYEAMFGVTIDPERITPELKQKMIDSLEESLAEDELKAQKPRNLSRRLWGVGFWRKRLAADLDEAARNLCEKVDDFVRFHDEHRQTLNLTLSQMQIFVDKPRALAQLVAEVMDPEEKGSMLGVVIKDQEQREAGARLKTTRSANGK